MLNEKEKNRYKRQIQLADFGIEGQLALKKAKVLVIGAGGLGCPVLQYLAAAGVGSITVVDGDAVSESNLQRQILFSKKDINRNKAKIAAEKARELNDEIEIEHIESYLTKELALSIFDKFDLVVDCCDNYGTRYLINDVCVYLKKPFVSAAIYKYEGQISVFNVEQPNKTFSANLRDVFGKENEGSTLNCSDIGVVATLPGIMGTYQANETIKYFTSKNHCLVNKLLCINSKTMQQQIITIIPKSGLISMEEINTRTYNLPCSAKLQLPIDEFIHQPSNIIVDVRNLEEEPQLEHVRHTRIPLSELPERINELNAYKKILFVCKSGKRSQMAEQQFKALSKNIDCFSYKRSIEEFIEELEKHEYSNN